MDTAVTLTALGVPVEPVRSPGQLLAIHAAMMEELGIGRMDTLPLEDRRHDGHIPRTQPALRPRISMNDELASWHNFDPGDVPEALQQLNSIANGQLYRLRRGGASSGPIQASPTRGGHTASRGGHSPSRGGRRSGGPQSTSPARGDREKKGRRGGLPGPIRGGRGSSSKTGHDAVKSSSTPSTYFNDSRLGVNNHARIKQAIEHLKRPPRPTARLQENQPPTPSDQAAFGSTLATPAAFLSAMGVGMAARSGNVPVKASSGVSTTPPQSSSPARIPGTNHVSTISPSRTRLSGANASTRVASSRYAAPQPTVIARSPTPLFANASTGMASSRYALPQPAPAPSTKKSWTANSSSTSEFIVPAARVATVDSAAVTSDAALALNSLDSSNTPNVSAKLFDAAQNVTHLSDTKSALSDSSVSGPPVILFKKPGKAARNGAARTDGIVRLVKTVDSLVLEFAELKKSEFSKGCAVQWRLHLSGFTFTSGTDSTVTTITLGPDTFDVKLRFPHEREDFEKHLQSHLTASVAQPEDEEEAIVDAQAVIIHSPEGIKHPSVSPITPYASVNGRCAALNVSDNVNGSSVPVVDVPASEISQSVHDVSTNMNNLVVASVTRNPDTLSTPTIADIVNDSVLIDFSEGIPEANSALPASHSEINNLLCINNYFVVASVLEAMNKASGKSFLESNRDENVEEITSLAEDFTLPYLRCDSSFRQAFSKTTGLAYAKEVAERALELARAQAQARDASERRYDYEVADSPSNIDDSAVYGENAKLEDNYSKEVSDSEEHGESQQMTSCALFCESQQSIDSEQVAVRCQANQSAVFPRTLRKYSIQELTGLHNHALSITSQLPQPPTTNHSAKVTSSRPSREQFAAKFASPGVRAVFQGQSFASLKSPTASTIELSRRPPQAPSDVENPSDLEDSLNDTALYGMIGSTLGQAKPSNVKPKGNHHFAASKDLTRLTSELSDLKIVAASKKESALLATQQGRILEISDSKEKMKKAELPGLSSSRWAPDLDPAHHIMPSLPSFTPPQQQMLQVSGLKVVGTIPVVEHQLEPSPVHQYNGGFQLFPLRPYPIYTAKNKESMFQSFPPRSNMFERQPSGSSTASESKFFSSPTSPQRIPLSPRKASIQATLKEKIHRSLTDRHD